MIRARLAELWLYPVKGLRGQRVTEAVVEPRGLGGDRRCMVVDREGRFMTQRHHPNMGRIAARIDGPALVLDDGTTALTVDRAARGAILDVQVWSSTVRAVELPLGSQFLSEALGTDCRLVLLPDEERRAVTSSSGRPGDEVSFADAFPFLLTSTSSLADLEKRAETRLLMERFRANFVVEGLEPWAEDQLGTFAIGEVRFVNRKPCDRCSVTTLDPETGRAGKEPLRTLATFREREGKVYFGVNLVAEMGGVVRVGDRIRQ